jgi:hypothetical protein
MIVVGLVLLVRFFAVGGPGHVEAAGAARTESMVLGALMASLGLLLAILGATGAICTNLGVTAALPLIG